MWRSSVRVDLDAASSVSMAVFELVPAVDGNRDRLIRTVAHIIKSEYSAAKLNKLGVMLQRERKQLGGE